ncbi:MAG: tRNA preQ1(34) S-adenosylmethionine ribosyltransferase-isomerase QueA [Planctomycetota bacterium]|jgi:S-adenosylmethionine:tRNA ribosyltransferase-isomerase
MKTAELDYHLPPELIAQQPLSVRSDSRLLTFNRSTGELTDSHFANIGDFLLPGDCLVLNDTKVLPARFFARRSSGGKLEGLFLTEETPNTWEIMLKGARKVRQGEIIYLKDKAKADFCKAEIAERTQPGRCRLNIASQERFGTILDKIGYPPLPPYIKRGPDPRQAEKDKQHYQTVYARHSGAIAAPTAGLHFTEGLIEHLKAAKVAFAYLTLHVGVGTFQPIITENLEEHQIYKEKFSIDEKNAQIINATKKSGGRIIAVGTTSVRALETAATGSGVEALRGTTGLFITPSYEFKIVDAMVTNFHLPKSSLLALVAAFAGLQNILQAYRHAIEQRYRFYSYGDATLIV